MGDVMVLLEESLTIVLVSVSDSKGHKIYGII